MQDLVKPAISFLVQSHQEFQKKNNKRIIQRNILLHHPLSMYPQIIQILDQTFSEAL